LAQASESGLAMTSASSQTSSSNKSAAADARAQWAEMKGPRASLLAAAGRDIVSTHVRYECAACHAVVRSETCTCAKRRWTLTTELRSECA